MRDQREIRAYLNKVTPKLVIKNGFTSHSKQSVYRSWL